MKYHHKTNAVLVIYIRAERKQKETVNVIA